MHALVIDLPTRVCPQRFDHQKERSKILIWKSFFCKVQGWRQSFDCLATLSRSKRRKKNVTPITVLVPKKSSLKCASCVTAKLSAFRKLMPSIQTLPVISYPPAFQRAIETSQQKGANVFHIKQRELYTVTCACAVCLAP